MKTSSKIKSSIENVSQVERVYRGTASLILVSAVLVGVTTVPAVMFAVTVASIYLGMTAVLGLDPFYALAERLTHQKSSEIHHRSGQSYA